MSKTTRSLLEELQGAMGEAVSVRIHKVTIPLKKSKDQQPIRFFDEKDAKKSVLRVPAEDKAAALKTLDPSGKLKVSEGVLEHILEGSPWGTEVNDVLHWFCASEKSLWKDLHNWRKYTGIRLAADFGKDMKLKPGVAKMHIAASTDPVPFDLRLSEGE